MPEDNEPTPVSPELPPSASEQPTRGSTDTGRSDAAPITERTVNESHGRPKTEFERRLGMLSTMVQILAIVLAGIVAVIKFDIFDRPTLLSNFNVSGHVEWDSRPGSCLANVDVDVTNMSKSNVAVNMVRGRAWLVDEPTGDQAITYFDISSVANKSAALPSGYVAAKPFSYEKGPLVQEYRPGQPANHTFEWYIQRKKNTYALFAIDIFEGPGETNPLGHAYTWDLVCGDLKTQEQMKQRTGENPVTN
jgi:hypothetical protein